MPASRLALSYRQDLSLPHSQAVNTEQKDMSSAYTISQPNREGRSPASREIRESTQHASAIATTLRKSYRRILSLSPGLRVRMRTLLLPQLLPVRESSEVVSNMDSGETDGEPRIVLCVEIENPAGDLPVDGFEVEAVHVDVTGKGGKAVAELVCQPETQNEVFPLRLRAVEQYNLLYAVTIASVPDNFDKGDEQRPVSIIIIGRPYMGEVYPTSSFESRWNCTLDMTSFNTVLSNFDPPLPFVPTQTQPYKRTSTRMVAGDKRYSLANLHANRSDNRRPPLPSGLGNRVSSFRGTSMLASERASGLLISVKILPQAAETGNIVRALEPFSIEVFVQNRTEGTKRFKLSIPGRDASVGTVRDIWEKRRRRRNDEPDWGQDDPGKGNTDHCIRIILTDRILVLRQLLQHYLASAPALVPLENDVRCGPLLPGASLSSRIRFLALRDGVHKLDKLCISGLNNEFDFIMR